MSDDIDDINDARWKIGAEKIADVYQGMVPAVAPGLMEFSDITDPRPLSEDLDPRTA